MPSPVGGVASFVPLVPTQTLCEYVACPQANAKKFDDMMNHHPTNRSFQSCLPALLVGCLCLSQGAASGAEPGVERSFALARENPPAIAPGTVIGKANVEQYKEWLDGGMLQAIRNGWYEIRVAPSTSFDVDKAYIDATQKQASKAPTRLGDKPGEILGYAGGRPFPEEPQPGDARAGEKIAWNFRYMHGDSGAILPIQWKYRNLTTGQVERLLRVEVRVLKFKYRTNAAPLPDITPNPSNLLEATYLKVLEPIDFKNTQLLIQRYDDDSRLDDSYMYFGFQRRVRRLATGQTTDAFLGSDVMIEDFNGYNARISEMKWTYKGSRQMLSPYYNHNELKLSDEFKDGDAYQYVNFTGQGGCFPDITWQVRKVHVVEAEPLSSSHPVSKRIFYFDAQTYAIAQSLIYDRKGELWKISILGKSHPDHHLAGNKGSGMPLNDAGAMIDVQAKHCSTGQFKMLAQAALSPNLFQVQNLRGGD